MTRMLLVVDVQDTIKKHQAQIITSLKDPDIRYGFQVFSIAHMSPSHCTFGSLHCWEALLLFLDHFSIFSNPRYPRHA
jgi:hypothetical protein